MFIDILKNLIKENGITAAKLSKQTGIPKTTISGWLNAGRKPDYEALRKLSQYFDVKADYLLELEDEIGEKININNSFNYNSGNINFKG